MFSGHMVDWHKRDALEWEAEAKKAQKQSQNKQWSIFTTLKRSQQSESVWACFEYFLSW